MGLALASVTADPFLIRSLDTGVIHVWYRIGGRNIGDTRCRWLDNWQPVSLDSVSNLDIDAFCAWCFPRDILPAPR